MTNLISVLSSVLLGLFSGSILNYLSDVLPRTRTLSSPICTRCEARLDWYDYVFLNRRCRNCGQVRPIRSWVVVVAYIGLSVWLASTKYYQVNAWLDWLLLCLFGLVIIIDVEHRLIMNAVSLAGAVIGLVYGALLHGVVQTLLGGIAGFGVMLVLYKLGDVFAGWISRRRSETLEEVALGFGDVNLAGILGLVLGWPGIVAGLFFTVLFGGGGGLLYLIWMKVRGSYQVFTPIPYGPYLILAAFYLLFLRG